LARRPTPINPHEAMFAGLFHDIGDVCLLSRTPAYPEMAGEDEVLDEVLREWHPSIGQAVMHSFALSDEIMDAIGEHETGALEIQPNTVAGIVRLANAIADESNPARTADNDVAVPDAITQLVA